MIMKNKVILFTFTFSLFLFGSLATHAAKIKCWTNNEGIRECGTSVPPEYAQKGHQKLNTQGRVVEKQERAKSEQEIAEEARVAAHAKEQERKAEEQARKDKILLDTFTKIEDIEKARDDSVSVIESRITLTKKRNEKIQADLNNRIKTAAAAERSGKKPNEALLKDIESLRRQIKNNETFIQERRKEQESVKQAYNSDIERFTQLKASGK